jgi:hypothetical protein
MASVTLYPIISDTRTVLDRVLWLRQVRAYPERTKVGLRIRLVPGCVATVYVERRGDLEAPK